MNDAHALVVLPGAAYGQVDDLKMRRWLSTGNVSLANVEAEMLTAVTTAIAAPAPSGSFAALRFWGQTGNRSGRWIAAADPVHFEARLRDLAVRPLSHDEYSIDELRSIFDTLQRELGTDGGMSFARIGKLGYLQCDEPLATAPVSAAIAGNHRPDKFTPVGGAAKNYHQLLGEVQMLLHSHDVNTARELAGRKEINSLWMWGGGIAPQQENLELPNLYSDDPLFSGYWASHNCAASTWQSIDECVANSPRGFVAITPETASENARHELEIYLRELQRHLHSGRINRLTLMCRDGLTIRIGKFDRLRFWRSVSPLLQEMNQ